MAQGDITFFNSAKGKLGDGSIDWDTHTIKCALINGTPNIDTHDFWNDLSASEVSLTNYTAGGATMTCSAPTIDTTNDWAEYDANDVTWTALGSGTVSHAIIYRDTGDGATSPLIAHVELTTQPNGGNYTIAWHADGVFKLA